MTGGGELLTSWGSVEVGRHEPWLQVTASSATGQIDWSQYHHISSAASLVADHHWIGYADSGTAGTRTFNYALKCTIPLNASLDGYFTWNDGLCQLEKKTDKQKLREIIAGRIAPAVHVQPEQAYRTYRCPAMHTTDPREACARDTLRMVAGNCEYRRFLRHGFVSVRNPKSGLVYQIRAGQGLTSVYRDGKMIKQLCVILKGQFPPTDELIVRYLMAINNEDQFWASANESAPLKTRQPAAPTIYRPLTEIYSELKGVA